MDVHRRVPGGGDDEGVFLAVDHRPHTVVVGAEDRLRAGGYIDPRDKASHDQQVVP